MFSTLYTKTTRNNSVQTSEHQGRTFLSWSVWCHAHGFCVGMRGTAKHQARTITGSESALSHPSLHLLGQRITFGRNVTHMPTQNPCAWHPAVRSHAEFGNEAHNESKKP